MSTNPRDLEPQPSRRLRKLAEAGTTIAGRYTIESEIGVGGFGRVFLATQIGMGRQVALKLLRPEIGADPIAVKRFYREARTVSQLSHPNVVSVLDFGIDQSNELPYIAMQFVEGRDLAEVRIDDGLFDERRACRLLSQVAKALVEAHSKGVIHRDLKPSNIMVTRYDDGDEHVTVLDFGVAKVLDSDESGDIRNLTQAGWVLGTPQYMSPEQATAKSVDGRADLYSLGCILHEMFVGRTPFASKFAGEILAGHISRPPPPLPETLASGTAPTPGLRRLHAALLAKSASKRPESAVVVARMLAALSRGEAIDDQLPRLQLAMRLRRIRSSGAGRSRA